MKLSSPHTPSPFLNAIFNRRSFICIFLGFTSGLPLFILLQLVPAWLRKEGVGLGEIGLFALVQFPYVWKFLWAPLVDRFELPFLGLRRGWMLVMQLLLLLSIAAMPLLNIRISLWPLAYLACAVAFFSATQDIVIDAYRRELLPEAELGFGNAVHINSYRIAGLVPGGLSLILADHFSWNLVFLVTSLFMLAGIMLTLCIKEPEHGYHPVTLKDAVLEPLQEFFARKGPQQAWLLLGFLFCYKLGDSLATALSTPFYIDIGFELTEIGLIAKNVGLWSSVIGTFVGGIAMIRLGINRALWVFGVVQIVSILGFAVLAHIGPNPAMLALVVAFEYLGVGLGTAAFVAFICKHTSLRYTATQFALLTAIAALPRTFANASTGYIVELIGWEYFFYVCTAFALPGMMMLLWIAPWNEPADDQQPGTNDDSMPSQNSAISRQDELT